MNIYDARNFQKQVVKEAHYGAFSGTNFHNGELVYYVIAPVIPNEKYQEFEDGNILVNLTIDLAEGIIVNYKNHIHWNLCFHNGKLRTLLIINID